MAESAESIGKAVASYLGMTYRPVGVKLLKEPVKAKPSHEKKTYCRFVHDAALGQDVVIDMADLNCLNAEVVLGFREPKYVAIEPRVKEKIEAIRIGPLEEADVVLFVLNAEQVMTLSILLEGVRAESRGDMGVCGEATAKVYNEGQTNVTFLCNGARLYGGYEPNHLIISLPYQRFLELPQKMSRFSSLSKKAKEGFSRLLLRIR